MKTKGKREMARGKFGAQMSLGKLRVRADEQNETLIRLTPQHPTLHPLRSQHLIRAEAHPN